MYKIVGVISLVVLLLLFSYKCNKNENFKNLDKYFESRSKITDKYTKDCTKTPRENLVSGDKNIFERLDNYGKYMPGRINLGRSVCIRSTQNELICDPNNSENFYDESKVGYPSRRLMHYEGTNPILYVRPRYRGIDVNDNRRYF